MSAGVYTTPRERMFIAKMELLKAEQEERAKYKLAKRESRRVNNAKAEEPVASSSRSVSHNRPSSILRKSSTLPPPSSYQPPAPSSPQFTQKVNVPSSSAPSLPLPPAPMISQNTDFGPPIQLPSPATASTNGARRRSSRVRFSDQQLQPTPNLSQASIVSRSTSLKNLRRESSIDGLRQDLMQASSSLHGHRRPSVNSTGRSNSLGGKRSSMASISSSINSDPFNWTTSSFGSGSGSGPGSDLDITSEIDIGSRKQSLANTFDVDLNLDLDQLEDEFELEMRDELGFKPQILPYPKISKRLSRLSLESTNSSVWSNQDHMTNLSRIKTTDTDSIHSVDSQSVNTHSTLKDTLERSSLGSAGSVDGQSRQSSQFSLEARIIGSGAESRKSSYAPSSSTVENGYTSTPSSLRSSTSENEQSSQTNTSICFQLPSKASALAYSTLLPTRRKQSGAIDEHMPHINRGEWQDPELGLSPRSGPIRVSGSMSTVSRRGTKLAEEILIPPEVEHQEAEDLGAKVEDKYDEGIIAKTSNPEQLDRAEYPNEKSDVMFTQYKGHIRSESTFSAIMAFPIPPDRKVENVSVQDDTGTEQEIVPQVETSVEEKVIELTLNTEVTVPAAVQSAEWQGDANEPLVISLNSPFVEIPSTNIATLPSMLQIDIPHVDVEQPTMTPLPQACPSSPELEDILRTVTRPRRARRSVRADDINETDTEESDLDIASPLVKVALSSRILSPKSRLLSASSSSSPISRPGSMRSVSANSISTLSSLRSGLGLTSGRGWSGSESEEEDWITTVREIRERKSPVTPRKKEVRRKSEGSTIQLGHEMVTPTQIKRLSTISTISSKSNSNSNNKSMNRYSQLSEISTITTTTTTSSTSESHLPITPLSLEVLTPGTVGLTRTSSNASSTSSSNNNKIGNFPWGLSSPPDSPIRGLFVNNLSPTREFFTSFRDTSRGKKGKRELPIPAREDMLEDWGEPEILIDQHDELSESDTEERSLRGSISTMSLKSDISILAERYSGIESRRSTIKLNSRQKEEKRSASPDLWMEEEGEKSLMDEEMPEM
ncbi:hypothetical protein I204_00525 [Kwoniella mangroviensis CBS 8886]|nr:hypothetical protein I204_00525 [Kwoniella mangroviensis CBS 8886]